MTVNFLPFLKTYVRQLWFFENNFNLYIEFTLGHDEAFGIIVIYLVCLYIGRQGGCREDMRKAFFYFLITKQGNPLVLSRSNRALFLYTWDGVLQKKIDLDVWAQRMAWINVNEPCR